MNLEDVIKLMETNSLASIKDMKLLLLKVADNILKSPENALYRTLKKSNASVSKKILAMKGGHEMLLFMGFTENSENYTFPPNVPYLNRLRKIREDLGNWEPIHRKLVEPESDEIAGPSTPKNTLPQAEKIIARPIPLPPLFNKYANPFLRKVAKCFHQALVYKNAQLKERARNRIPVTLLELNALKKMRDIQKAVKQGRSVNLSICMQDLVLVELLRWFKEDFFTWVDSPDCTKCSRKTKFSHSSTDQKLMIYTDRIEMFKCESCGEFTSFPRYNDLNILLETRRGRCGEWANVFTLLCHAMGWDARLVIDETDHVWTEVYSPTQNRWVHCDPCDNVCDTPLMYEHGWKKSLSYIMAYSPDDIQDVSWRYSSNHKELLKRRRECTELELVKAIVDLRKERLETVSEARRNFVVKRALGELAELLIERQPKDDEMRGRSSGDLDWRLARGETTELNWKETVFGLFNTQVDQKKHSILYSCALDRYETRGEGSVIIERWSNGILDQDNIMRKEEKDWKMVYLCRKEGADFGYIAWKVLLRETEKSISSITLKMDNKTFENGSIDIRITGDNDDSLKLPPSNEVTTMAFHGSKTLKIEVKLTGGKGKEAWQHAQLFRQSIDSTDYPFQLHMTFE